MTLDPEIEQKAMQVRQAQKGLDVRESLASSVEFMDDKVNTYQAQMSGAWDDVEQAESVRVTAETARVQAETTRQTNEGNRQTAEQSRVAAETARETAFAGMQHIDANAELAAARQGKDSLLANLQAKDSQLADNTTQLSQNIKSDNIKFALKAKSNKSSYGLYTTNVAGDSLSYGQGCANISSDSYTGVLRKMFQLENDTKNYGYVSMQNQITDTYGTYKDISEISYASTAGASHWSVQLDDTCIGEYSATSNTLGDQVYMHLPQNCKYFRIWCNGDCGNFKISVNGTIVNASLSLAGTGLHLSDAIATNTDSTDIYIVLEKLDTTLSTICGLIYFNDELKPIFNNYSRAGAHLSTIDNSVLDVMCDTDILFLEYGINDEAANTLTDFQNKLNYIQSKVVANGAYVVVLDFIWTSPLSQNSFKQALYNFYKNVPHSMYLNFLEILNIPRDMLTTAGILQPDNTHLTPFGAKLVAEYIAKKIHLTYSSKEVVDKQRLLNYLLENVTPTVAEASLQNGWVNFGSGYGNVRYYKDNSNIVHVDGLMKSGTITANTLLFTLPVGYRPATGIILNVGLNTGTGKIAINADGTVNAWTTLDATFTSLSGISFLATT